METLKKLGLVIAGAVAALTIGLSGYVVFFDDTPLPTNKQVSYATMNAAFKACRNSNGGSQISYQNDGTYVCDKRP